MVHALECCRATSAPDARDLARAGRRRPALIVVPNRRGLWCLSERTPVRPRPALQLGASSSDALRSICSRPRRARARCSCRRPGRACCCAPRSHGSGSGCAGPSAFAGVLLMTAEKQIYAAPVGARHQARAGVPAYAPVPRRLAAAERVTPAAVRVAGRPARLGRLSTNSACSLNRLLSQRLPTIARLGAPSAAGRCAARSRRRARAHRRSKSRMRAEMDVGRVVPGVGQAARHRHAAAAQQVPAHPPVAEIGERDDRRAGRCAAARSSTCARLAHRLQGLAQDDVVEGAVGIVARSVSASPWITDEPAATQALTPAWLSSMPRPSTCLVARQIGEQRAVAAADVEHPRAGRDHVGDQAQVAARMAVRRWRHVAGSPALSADRAARRRRRGSRASTRWNSGSSSRKASWPLSVSISTKLTLARGGVQRVHDARGSRRSGTASRVVKETTQKRARRAGEGVGQHAAVLGGEVEIVHRPGDVEVGVGVEAVDEADALVAQIALDLEVGVEAEGHRRRGPAGCGRTCGAAPPPTDR